MITPNNSNFFLISLFCFDVDETICLYQFRMMYKWMTTKCKDADNDDDKKYNSPVTEGGGGGHKIYIFPNSLGPNTNIII